MNRTQIQLTDEQTEALRRASRNTGKSIAELIRKSVEAYLDQASNEERIERARKVAGRFSSGRHDVSERHDDYLAEAFEG